jgi:hypothetical protein
VARWRDTPSGIVCGAIIAPLLLAAVCWQVVPHIAEQQAATAWPAAPGIMTRSEVIDRGRFSRGGRYTLHLEYAYSVNGREYHADRFRADPNFFWGEPQVAAERPVGAAVTVYYNPVDPAKAVLDAGFSGEAIIGASMILILVFAVFGWSWWRFYRLVRYGPSTCPQ